MRTDELLVHSEGVLDTADIEPLHDMRVATRRLRAALEVFEPCFPRKRYLRVLREVKALADALGERRDRDVTLAALEGFASGLEPADRPGVESLVERMRAEQAEANEALAPRGRRRSGSERLAGRLRKLAAAADGAMKAQRVRKLDPDGPLVDNAARIVATRLDEVRALGSAALDTDAATDQHDLRIAAKRLRYVLELTGDCFGDAADAARLQRPRHPGRARRAARLRRDAAADRGARRGAARRGRAGDPRTRRRGDRPRPGARRRARRTGPPTAGSRCSSVERRRSARTARSAFVELWAELEERDAGSGSIMRSSAPSTRRVSAALPRAGRARRHGAWSARSARSAPPPSAPAWRPRSSTGPAASASGSAVGSRPIRVSKLGRRGRDAERAPGCEPARDRRRERDRRAGGGRRLHPRRGRGRRSVLPQGWQRGL